MTPLTETTADLDLSAEELRDAWPVLAASERAEGFSTLRREDQDEFFLGSYAAPMDWKLFATTFGTIFLAEMGDKTQLAAMALAGGGFSRWNVFAAASLALIATTLIAVLAGGAVARAVPEIWIKRGAGILFIVMGVLFLLSASGGETDDTPSHDPVEFESTN